MSKRLSRGYWWVLKKIDKPLKMCFVLIGAFSVLYWSFGVFGEYIKYKYQNETITIYNVEAYSRDEEGDKQPDNTDIPEVEPVVSVDEQIRQVATERGFEEVDNLIKIAECESSLNPNAAVNPVNNSFDRGLYQISRKWHPEVSDECAVDVECATIEAIRIQQKAGWNAWACNKYLGF